ncbi:hypothetical protein [Deinococcus detaillensis]|uniref:hypothetical protein n=1 Tax=Deinococcus detaillensis TaxID=2592048 RepID=UPI00163D9D70|nr:hypothetical protein [Deinococcus detaillensis]
MTEVRFSPHWVSINQKLTVDEDKEAVLSKLLSLSRLAEFSRRSEAQIERFASEGFI